MPRTIAIYPGSFKPFHVGHDNILKKSQKIFGFENVMLAFGINPDKHDMAPIYDTTWSVSTQSSSSIVKYFGNYKGYLHDFVSSIQKFGDLFEKDANYVIIRGLRNGADLSYEENQIKFIRHFKPDMNFAFILCDPEFNHISSSAIRSMEKIKPGSGKDFLVDLY